MKEIEMPDLNYYTAKASMEMAETQDAFIFRTIGPFVNDVAGFEISKKELVDAIQLIRLRKKVADIYGVPLVYIESDLSKATDISRMLDKAYNRGFIDGMNKERERIIKMLGEDLEETE